jgi:hypothetical protein
VGYRTKKYESERRLNLEEVSVERKIMQRIEYGMD